MRLVVLVRDHRQLDVVPGLARRRGEPGGLLQRHHVVVRAGDHQQRDAQRHQQPRVADRVVRGLLDRRPAHQVVDRAATEPGVRRRRQVVDAGLAHRAGHPDPRAPARARAPSLERAASQSASGPPAE